MSVLNNLIDVILSTLSNFYFSEEKLNQIEVKIFEEYSLKLLELLLYFDNIKDFKTFEKSTNQIFLFIEQNKITWHVPEIKKTTIFEVIEKQECLTQKTVNAYIKYLEILLQKNSSELKIFEEFFLKNNPKQQILKNIKMFLLKKDSKELNYYLSIATVFEKFNSISTEKEFTLIISQSYYFLANLTNINRDLIEKYLLISFENDKKLYKICKICGKDMLFYLQNSLKKKCCEKLVLLYYSRKNYELSLKYSLEIDYYEYVIKCYENLTQEEGPNRLQMMENYGDYLGKMGQSEKALEYYYKMLFWIEDPNKTNVIKGKIFKITSRFDKLKEMIQGVRSDLNNRIDSVKYQLENEIYSVKYQLQSQIQSVESSVSNLRDDLNKSEKNNQQKIDYINNSIGNLNYSVQNNSNAIYNLKNDFKEFKEKFPKK